LMVKFVTGFCGYGVETSGFLMSFLNSCIAINRWRGTLCQDVSWTFNFQIHAVDFKVITAYIFVVVNTMICISLFKCCSSSKDVLTIFTLKLEFVISKSCLHLMSSVFSIQEQYLYYWYQNNKMLLIWHKDVQ
jgi:hypothetical protein